jgi:hypothetical protein
MRLPTENFGAILQSFALCKIINDLGYETKVINYVSDSLEKEVDKLSVLNLDKFRENNIKMTRRCISDIDLINLNKEFDTFVVGSDQVWNYNYLNGSFKENIGKYFLNFVDPLKKIFSYAASFAEDHWDGNDNEIKIVKEALERFSSVSVREKSGVDICDKLFDIKAEYVLDPTLLLDVNDYQKLIDSEYIEQDIGKYFAYFTLDKNLEKNIFKNKVLNELINRNLLQLKNIRGGVKKVFDKDKFIYNSIPVWLNYIKNSEFIITDSYHCVIFAILFRKQFLVIERDCAGNERLNSLLSLFDIRNRFYSSLDDIKYSDVVKNKIDYIKVYGKLSLEKEKSMKYLKKNLSNNPQVLALQNKISDLEFQNRALQSKSQELELTIQSYLNTKTFRYANEFKKILLRIGIRRFKL